MKIIYEPGDLVDVEDNTEAGEASCSTVELLQEVSKGTWLVEIKFSFTVPQGTQLRCADIYFHP